MLTKRVTAISQSIYFIPNTDRGDFQMEYLAAVKGSPLTCPCTVARCPFIMLSVNMENLVDILCMGWSSNTLSLVQSDPCDCRNMDLSLVAHLQLYSPLTSSPVHAVTPPVCSIEVTLICAGVHGYPGFS